MKIGLVRHLKVNHPFPKKIFVSKLEVVKKQLTANNESDVLIVSHWFVMRVMRQELIKNGFVGDDIKSDEYGVLCVYEKS
jgi:hypothetical protein